MHSIWNLWRSGLQNHKGKGFFGSRVGRAEFSGHVQKIPVSLWGNCPCPYLPPTKGSQGIGYRPRASFNALSYTILEYSKTLPWFLKVPCLTVVGEIIPSTQMVHKVLPLRSNQNLSHFINRGHDILPRNPMLPIKRFPKPFLPLPCLLED